MALAGLHLSLTLITVAMAVTVYCAAGASLGE